ISPSLRREIGRDPSYELWVYGDNRSCRMTKADAAVACAFRVGQAQIAYAANLDEIPAAVEAWLSERIDARTLAARFRAVSLERHAEILESNPARWHWMHLLERVSDAEDVLAPLRELIEVLATKPQASQFFSFSSLNSFCFSASSHYPWAREG